MLKFYCLITGDDYNIVKDETPLSKKRIKLYAVGITIPVLLWAVQSYLLVTQVMGKDFSTAVIVMVISVILIFAIEKSIIMSNGSWVIAAFRIVLGLTIAIIGSLALDEVIFKNDIDTQFSENKRESIEKSLVNIKNDLNYKISEKEKEVKENKSIWEIAELEAIKEADGTAGTRIPNVGKITELKLSKAAEKKAFYDKSNNELISMRNLNDSIIKSHEEKLSNNYNDASLLLRIKALFNLIGKDGSMKWTYIVFTLFIILLESIVIIIKLFSKETNYEKKMKLIEEIGEKRMQKIMQNNSPGYDSLIFKGELKAGTELIKRQVNGMFN